MSEQSIRWRRAVPVAALALATVAGLASATSAVADPLGASGAAKGAPAAPAARVSDAGCTLSPSLNLKSEQASCIGVGAKLSAVPALGKTATLTVTVKTGRVENGTKVTVDLPTNLAFADGTAASAAVTGAGTSSRATIATVDLAKGATRTWTRTVKAVATGTGEIKASALAVVGAGRTDGGADYVHLTVGADSAASRTGIAQKTGNQATARTTAKVVDGRPAGRASVALPSAGVPAQRNTASGPGTSCATGNWVFVNQNGTTVGTYQAVVQVWRSGSIVASGYAQGSGAYNLCWSSGGTSNSVYVRFVHTNNAWKVVTNSGSDYAYVSSTQSVADGGTVNFGTLQPADSTQMRALHAYYDYAVMYDWIYQNATFGSGCWSPFSSTCRQLVVHWQSDSTDGTYWNGEVHLLAASPDSEDEPVHEAGHDLMYGLYGNTFPSTTNCSPHYLLSISSTTCGWTEGWADWIDTSVWGNTIYTFAGQSTVDFNRTWNDGYDTGDQVEGRIVQALDSLNDGVKYPFDNDNAGDGGNYRYAAKNFNVLRTYKPNTFAAYWSGRAGLGYDTSQTALSALYQGTIDYGFRNPLTDGQLRVFPQAVPPHNYSATTTRGYWSAVAVRPGGTGDSDLTLYNDAAQSSALASSSFGGQTVDFVAINSNSGARALQTYYPRVTKFDSSTNGYYLQYQQGSTTFSSGVLTASLATNQVIANYDSSQTAGVPVYYRAVPLAGQSIALSFLQPGQTILSRGSAVNSSTGAAGDPVSLAATPSASGYGGLVLVNQGLSAGNVTLYADTTAPTGGSVVINNGAARTTSLDVTLTLSASDADTGVSNMQISTDGTFDTEPVVPYATTATATLFGQNGTKPVYVRYQNNAGMWSDPVLDRIKLQAPAAITSLSKTSGPVAGGTVISIVGNRFTGATQVMFGSTAATTYTVVNDIKINVTVPAGAVGAVNVRVTNPYGTSAVVTADRYTYVAAPTVTALSKSKGTTAGGNTIFITGTGFTGTTAVKFGTTAAASFSVVSPTRIQVTTPAHAAGVVDVRVTSTGGTSAVVAADAFTFQ